MNEETRVAADRIANQVRRLLTRETTFADLYDFIRKELQNVHESGQQDGISCQCENL